MRQLRPYQTQALDNVSAHWRLGARSVLLVSPTGSGKTTIGAEAIRRTTERGKKSLWLAHRRELIGQAFDRLTSEGIACGVIMADDKRANDSAPVQVCSVDTLTARGARPPADLVIWDEAHHCAAATWRDLLGDYSNSWHLGLTATPERGDKSSLGDMFEEMVVGASVKQLVADGFLVESQVLAPTIKTKTKTDSLGGMLAMSPVEAFERYAENQQTVVYCRFVEHAHQYAQQFIDAGIPAAAIDGSMHQVDRDRILSAFAKGEIKVVLNVYVLTEGWDVPATSCCIIARNIGHAGMYLQMAGRVLRPAPNKKMATIVDLAGSTLEFGLPDDERTYSLRGKAISTREKLSVCKVCGFADPGRPCERCGYESVAMEIPPVAFLASNEGTLEVIGQRIMPSEIDRDLLAVITRHCLQRGHKHGWIYHAYRKQTDGHLLPWNEVQAMVRMQIRALAQEQKSKA
jgi:superfamily II DNA or RNA helicase